MAIAEVASPTDHIIVESTLQGKIAALETKIRILEEKYNDLHERTITITENSASETTELAVAEITSTTIESTGTEEPSARKESSPPSRAKIVYNRRNLETGERRDELLKELVHTDPALTDTTYAFTLRKKLSHQSGEQNGGEIEFMNLDLWNLLKDLLSHYPHHAFRGSPQMLSSPYKALVHNWDKLEQATKVKPKDERDQQARADLKLLLDTISSGSGDPQLDKYFKTRDLDREQKVVTYDTLWTIFPPGTLIYGKLFQEQDQVLLVYDNVFPWPGSTRDERWNLVCWTYDWDGKKFRRMAVSLKFENFEEKKPITSLPYYPLELHENHENIRKDLIKRGKKYQEFCIAKQGSRMFDYKGEAIFGKKGISGVYLDDDGNDDDSTLKSSFKWFVEHPKRNLQKYPQSSSSDSNDGAIDSSYIDGAVMVDFESYFRYGPAIASMGFVQPAECFVCNCQDCQDNKDRAELFRTRFDARGRQNDDWENEQYLLCPPRVLGYFLRDKQWVQLQVTLLKKIPKKDPNDSWSTRLKLADGEETKKLILDLVSSHGNGESSMGRQGLEVNDIVPNKGKGLVILLYGPPGVGKTSTAETVATTARKPLFSISVADVGTKAKRVETNLASIFALATSWQAILLIDEADVFLESRVKDTGSSTEKNALVSVFLRVLEYYHGILILTTNQIAKFDVAVKSRVHIAVKYSDLNKQQTLDIFKGFLDTLDDRGLVRNYDEIIEWIDEDVHKMGLDGRQIRNVITCALGLARAEQKEKLDKKHIKKALTNVKDFKDEFIRQFEAYKTSQNPK